MKKKSMLIVAIILMSIGFAAISTTLVITGNAKVSENTDDFSVIFTKASIDGNDVYNSVVDNTKKIITFETSELKTLNQTSVLSYEVTNNSANYDAEVRVTCVPKSGTQAKYTSIKNKLENDAMVVKAKSSVNGTLTVTLNKTATEEVSEEYTCKLEFNAVERTEIATKGPTLYDLIKKQADKTTIINYSIGSGESGTNGIYTTTATEGSVPVYYYRGDADKVNNNIIFNNMCWKIIRTTETGGVKILYNGTPANGKCETQTGTSTQIGTSEFNEKYDDNAYVGYMYGTAGSSTYEATHANINDSTIKTYIDNWYKTNFDEITTNKLEDTVFCNDRSTKAYDPNTINIESYSRFGDLGYGTNTTLYGAAHRTVSESLNLTPTLKCKNNNDKFTVDNKYGNGNLTYPVGLITADETILAGLARNADPNIYINNMWEYWLMTPEFFSHDKYENNVACINYIETSDDEANINCDDSVIPKGVRPVVSLSSTTLVTGSGTTTNPYIVD